MLRNFNEAKKEVVSYCEKVLEMHKSVIAALKKENISDLKAIIHHDEFINHEKERITDLIGWTIVKNQPISYDLRRSMSYISIIKDLERVADIAKHVARTAMKALETENKLFQKNIKNIIKLQSLFVKNLENSLAIISEEDVDAGLLLITADKLVNEEYHIQFVKLVEESLKIKNDKDKILTIRIILSLKQIERAGDYLKNIVEEVIYIIKGQRIDN